MNPLVKTAAATLCAAALLLAATTAASYAQSTQIEQVRLTEDSLTRFLASYPEVKAVSKKYDRERSARDEEDGGPIDSLSDYMQVQGARGEMQAIIEKHGFDGFADWGKVAQSVAMAYGFVKSGQSPDEFNGMTEKALAKIQNNPRLSAEQKEKLAGMVRQQLGAVAQIRPLPGNLELVRARRDEIAAVMDSD